VEEMEEIGKSLMHLKNIILLQSVIFLLSLTNIVAKKASQEVFLSFNFIKLYSLEMIILAAYSYFWQKMLKIFDLSVAYANKASSIIWTLIWSVLIFDESIKITNLMGAAIIIGGINMVVRDDK